MTLFLLLGCVADSSSENQLSRKIEELIHLGLQKNAYPGCQVVVLNKGVEIYNRSFGKLSYDDDAMVSDSTLYDLASLTKICGTLLAVMKLYDEKRLDLNDSLSQFLPYFRDSDKGELTIRQLLLHETGLPPSLNLIRKLTAKNNQSAFIVGTVRYLRDLVSTQKLEDYQLQLAENIWLRNDVHDSTLKAIKELKKGPEVYVYSCVNFMLLKEVVEHLTSKPLDVYLEEHFWNPMGLKTLCFRPLRRFSRVDIAPTLKRDFIRGDSVWGFVQDPDAALLGGISGNAGMFGSASDVARLCQMFLDGGVWEGVQYLSDATIQLFTTTVSANGRRGLGFDRAQPHLPSSKNACGTLAPASVYGHTGYTGTCCWVDPTNHLVYVFLSNRTYPSDKTNLLARLNIRTNIQNEIYQSMK